MGIYTATIRWAGSDPEEFAKGMYSRKHEWAFDGGQTVKASPAVGIVREPMSDPFGVDPEEALVAAVSSCHFLFFLDLARRAGFVISDYEDEAEGLLERGDDGKSRITRVTLRPRIGWIGSPPDAAAMDELHHKAHDLCFIANSITSEVAVEPR